MTTAPCVHCGLPARAGRGEAHEAVFCCLGCRLAWAIAGAGGDEGQARWVQARFLLAALFAVAVMTLSLALYSGEVFDSGLDDSEFGQLLRWAALALSAPVLLLLAPALVDPAPHGWRRLSSVDLWILTAVSAAWLLSAWRVAAGSGRVYFESATMVLVLVTLGRYLDARAKVRVGEAADLLRKLLPERVACLRGGLAEPVPVAEVRKGDAVRVGTGERIPLDGIVRAGRAELDLSAMTGEHQPRACEPGAEVHAGARVLDGALDVEVTAAAGERLLDAVARALEEARSQRTPAMKAADRLAAVFLPAVLLLAVGTLLLHSLRGDWEEGAMRALAVLLVSCPCALGLATPLATWSGVGAALRRGVLVRNAAAFEVLARVRRVIFDKTGTLSTGRREVLRAVNERPGMRGIAAALTAASSHPTARAFATAAAPRLPDRPRSFPGRGLRGEVAGRRWWLGNRALCADAGVELPPEIRQAWDEADAQGLSAVALASDAGDVALYVLAEQLRPEAREALAELRAQGVAVEALSGDSVAAAGRTAAALGLAVAGGLLPPQKEEAVAARSREGGPVAFVGDGVNDGPALARADVSLAMGGGTDVARTAADLVLLRDDLHAVPLALRLAHAIRLRIRFNLLWALSYNPLFLFLAVTGRLSPVACALAMAASSLVVAGLSARDPLRSRVSDSPQTEDPPPLSLAPRPA